MKEVNLEEILKSIEPNFNPINVVVIKMAMKQACEQTVDLCAEINKNTIYHRGKWCNKVDDILNTKNQIK